MKKLFLLLTMGLSTMMFSQTEETNSLDNILGVWQNIDGEFLRVSRDYEKIIFVRRTSSEIKATGEIYIVDGTMRIVRNDVEDSYNLGYYVGNESMVICKPNDVQAWLWNKIGN